MPSGQGPARGRSRPSAPRSPRSGGPRQRLGEPGRGTGRATRIWPTAAGSRPAVAAGWGARLLGSTSERRNRPDRDDARAKTSDRADAARSGIRRAAGPARRILAPLRPRRISGRTAALCVVLLALMLAYAYPMRVYFAQQAQISQMQSDQAEQRRRIDDLAARVERWKDEDYLVAQIRSRLQMVREGELVYFVGAIPDQPGATADDGQEAWFRQLWSGLQAADDPNAP